MNWYFPPLTTLPTAVLGLALTKTRIEDREGRVMIFPQSETYFFRKPIYGFAVTHLQKYSKFGFLLTWPFCFHIWYTFKFQEGDDGVGWKPGTEKVLYARTPGYRKDTDYGMKWTWGYIGLHWD